MNKKTITYGAIAIVVIVVALLAWHFLLSGTATPATVTTGQTGSLPHVGTQSGTNSSSTGGAVPVGNFPNGNLTGATTQGAGAPVTFGVLGAEPVNDYFIDKQGDALAVEPDGKISETTNGQATFLNSSPVQDLIESGFSYDGAKAMVNFGDPTNPQTSVFDIASKAWSPLPSGIISPVWSPSDYRIAYLQTNVANGTESVMTLDVSKPSNTPVTLLTLHASDLLIKWLGANQIVIYDRPSVYVASSVWLYNIKTKALSSLVYEANGLETIWSGPPYASATSSVGLVFTAGSSQAPPHLNLQDFSGKDLADLTIITLPSKCFFANQTSTMPSSTPTSYLGLFCAVPDPQSNFAGSQLPDAYEQGALFSNDSFYLVNTATGALTNIFSNSPTPLDATDLKIFNNILFFVNRHDSKLYAISLAGE